MKRSSKLYLNLAFMLPRRLIYWCLVRAIAEVTGGKNSKVPLRKFKAEDIINRWSVVEKDVASKIIHQRLVSGL